MPPPQQLPYNGMPIGGEGIPPHDGDEPFYKEGGMMPSGEWNPPPVMPPPGEAGTFVVPTTAPSSIVEPIEPREN